MSESSSTTPAMPETPPPLPELLINDYDALTQWGVVAPKLSEALFSPPPVKDPIQSESRLEHGTRTIIPEGSVRLAKRDITLEIGLSAPNSDSFYSRLDSFISVLTSGWLNITSPRYRPGVTVKCRYVSCTQFTHYNVRSRAAKFILKLEEPNPNDRQ